MADFSSLDAATTALADQVSSTETGEASAVAFINGIASQIQAAVTAALTADNAADQNSINAANAAIAGVTARLNSSAAILAAALAAGPTA